MVKLIKIKRKVLNAERAYETRNNIINMFQNIINLQEKQTEEVNLDWLKYPDYFEKLVKDVNSNLELSVAFGRKKNKII